MPTEIELACPESVLLLIFPVLLAQYDGIKELPPPRALLMAALKRMFVIHLSGRYLCLSFAAMLCYVNCIEFA